MEQVKEKLSLMKRYPSEILLLVTLAAVGKLWFKIEESDNRLRTYIVEDKTALYNALSSCTIALNNNTLALTQNQVALGSYIKSK